MTIMTQQQPQQPQQPREAEFISDIVHDVGVMVKDVEKVNGAISDNSHSKPDFDAAATTTTSQSDSVANALSVTLSKLSLEERTKGIHELHGVLDIQDETDDMMKNKLNKMTIIADTFDENERTLAYRMAKEINVKYVEKIKLLCLRADYYDCDKAASRLVSFFSFKRRLFGDQKLTRDIVVEDFEGVDRELLESGYIQILQERDRAGRAVIFLMGTSACKEIANYPVEAHIRSLYYVFMAAVRDDEIQKRGVVFVYFLFGQTKFKSDRPHKLANFFWLLPVRLAAFHTCCNSQIQNELAKLIAGHMEGHYLCRFRTHNGSHLDCLYSLMTFGIPKNFWPIKYNEGGGLILEFHHQWLATMRNRERELPDKSSSSSSRPISVASEVPELLEASESKEIAVPGPLDIILGRGKSSKSSTGYLRLRNLVEQHSENYDTCERYDKTVIVDFIVQALHKGGCRFVRMTPNGIVEEPDTVAREKVSHAFRDARRTKKGTRSNGTKRSRIP